MGLWLWMPLLLPARTLCSDILHKTSAVLSPINILVVALVSEGEEAEIYFFDIPKVPSEANP